MDETNSKMKPTFPILHTERLLLRQFAEDDLENVFKGLSHPEIIKYYGISYQTLEESEEQLKFYKELEESKTGLYWAICSADNQTFMGAGGFNNLSQEHKKAEVGFWLLTDFWRKGIMSEAMPVICQYAFDILGLHRMDGFVETENTACKRAMEKLGFQHEGFMIDCEIKRGRFISLDIYAMLNR
jgi:ribosomal-protein-alanine N-acetyltransferase